MIAAVVLNYGIVQAGQDTGGGAGIFCPANISDQPRVQLLDLYEGRINENLVIAESSTIYEEQIQEALERLSFDFSLQADMRETLSQLKINHKFLPSGVSIHAPSDLAFDDTAAVILPTGCTIGAIGYYEKSGILKISKDAYDMLTETQKAAFWIHEAFYKLVRHYNKAIDLGTSKTAARDTRAFVSELFSVSHKNLYQKSTKGSWRRYGYYKTDSPWEIIPGKESYFSNANFEESPLVAPIKLPLRGGLVELFTDKASEAYIYCHEEARSTDSMGRIGNARLGHAMLPDMKNFKEGEKIILTTGTIPDSCKVIHISVWGGVNYSLKYNGEEILKSQGGFPPLSLVLPLYYD